MWPKPRSFSYDNTADECSLQSSTQFLIAQSDASSHMSRLTSAIDRTNTMIAELLTRVPLVTAVRCPISRCEITVTDPSAPLTKQTAAEAYKIEFTALKCALSCQTVYGCIRGLCTFLQLVNPVRHYLVPRAFEIEDEPQFPVRGLSMDTSRHYIPVSVIKQTLELMEMTKMNTFQWHIVDDQSFPLVLESLPRLSEEGAFDPELAVYEKTDIREIIEFAEARGIRVVPEIDIPGHTDSWMKAYPEMRGDATNGIDPTIPANYDIIRTVLTEVVDIFQTDMLEGKLEVHLGGDELWSGWDNAEIGEWMSRNQMSTQTDLIQYWLANVATIAKDLGIQVILWEDFLETTNNNIGNSDAESPFIWQTWKRDLSRSVQLANDINRPVIFSSAFYISNPYLEWDSFYSYVMNEAVGSGVIGGMAAIWTEFIDESNIFPQAWPSAAAIGERLWCGSYCDRDPAVDATLRLARWRCRVIHYFGMAHPEPVGPLGVNAPEREAKWCTDQEQWWCEEQQVVLQVEDPAPLQCKG